MTIVTRTLSPLVLRMCRESLCRLGMTSVDVIELGPGDHCLDADLEIRDFSGSDENELGELAQQLTVVYLLDREDIETFLSIMPVTAIGVLKPLNARILTASLSYAIEIAQSARHRVPCKGIDGLLRSSTRAVLEAQAYENDRTRFLARAAHDLKGPLSAITGYCDLLLGDEMGRLGARQRNAIATMQKSIDRLTRIAEDIVFLSVKAGSNQSRPMAAGDLDVVIEQTARDLLPITRAKRVRMTTHFEVSPEQVAFDTTDMERVITNLVDNACRFTPLNGLIEIKGYPYFWERREGRSRLAGRPDYRMHESRLPNSYRVDVHNSGPGIPDPELMHIFEEYATGDQISDRHSAGLGLAICRTILAKHSGRIWAENTKSGPIFSFVIPFPQRSATPVYQLTEACKVLAINA